MNLQEALKDEKDSISSQMLVEEDLNHLEDDEPTLVDILGLKKNRANEKTIISSKINISQVLNLPKL